MNNLCVLYFRYFKYLLSLIILYRDALLYEVFSRKQPQPLPQPQPEQQLQPPEQQLQPPEQQALPPPPQQALPPPPQQALPQSQQALPQPQQALPEEISFDLSKNYLDKDDRRHRIFIDNEGNVEVSYKYSDSLFESLTIYSIIIRTNDAIYIYKGNITPEDILFYIYDDVPENIPLYLNIENLDEPIIKINNKEISDIKIEENKVSSTGRLLGGKKSRKRRSQKKKRKSQKSKKLRNQNKSKKRRSQKKKQRKTHRKRK